MKYTNTFILIILISSISGIIFAILNNDFIKINDENKENIVEKNKNKLRYKDKVKYKDSRVINKKYNVIPLAINIDNNYILQAIVFLTSLLENMDLTTKYEIYIMIPNDLTYISKTSIDSLVEKYGKEKIKIQYINMKDAFSNSGINEHISTSAYYRLLLPSILPKIDKIIYSDCDVINFEDLSEMYNINLKDNIYYMGIPDYYDHHKELLEFGISTSMYMNSGILLMNLKSLRKYGIERKLINLCENYLLQHHDQTAINLVCKDNIGKLPIKYATFNFESYDKLIEYNKGQSWRYRYTEKELKEAYYNPVMLHYVGFDKPWSRREKVVKYEEYWWYYSQKTDFFENIISYFDYDTKEVNNIIKQIPKDKGLLRK
jgi:lipopolysaccharide biosynthesis glycosyltransferase